MNIICLCCMNLLTGMTLLFLAVSQTEGEEDTIFLIWEGQAALVSALNFACCTIFATTATGNVIIRDYGKEKASLLFSYPVPKKKIYQVKCLLVGALTLPVAITGIGVPLGVLYAVSWVTGIQLQMISDRFWMEVPVAGMSVVFVAGAMFTCNRTTNKIEKMEV